MALDVGRLAVTTDADLAARVGDLVVPVDDPVVPVDGLADPVAEARATGAIASSPTCSRT